MAQKDLPQGDHHYDAPLEKIFNKIVTPFEEFIHDQATSGLLLMACAVIALVIANSSLADTYHHFLETRFGIAYAGWSLEMSLHHWINDGLMALFFLVVGLEIKREVLVGELSDPRQAILPVIAAFGGMLIPALLYVAVNTGSDTLHGWGIPMATDIAFAVGVLVLLGSRIPHSLLTFLVALAIVDDLGGILVIALFYTEAIAFDALALAAVFLVILIVFNLVGIHRPLPYLVIGALLWLSMLQSGIHATLAGVLTALTIPARPKFNPRFFSAHVRELMVHFDERHRPDENIVRNEDQRAVLQTLENAVERVNTPLQRLEHTLHLPVAFLIIPIFALANAGIPIHMDGLGAIFLQPVTLGIMVGLLIGKVLGIAGVSLLAIKLGIARLPQGATPAQLIGVGLVGGIGFTMSIFIAELGFSTTPEYLLMAKTGVLFASLIAGISGFIWLYFIDRRART